MTSRDARRILGLAPDADPRPQLDEIKAARRGIEELVRKAPNPGIAARYQQGLDEFDRARAVLLADLGAEPAARTAETEAPAAADEPQAPARPREPKPEAKPADAAIKQPSRGKAVPPAAAETAGSAKIPPPPQDPAPAAPAETKVSEKPASVPQAEANKAEAKTESYGEEEPWDDEDFPPDTARMPSLLAWVSVFLIGAAAGVWLYLHGEENKELARQQRITMLEKLGTKFIENRQWGEAASSFDEIELLLPGAPMATRGRDRIAKGLAEEQNQFIAYWSGQAAVELETGRIEEAEAAARMVLDAQPDNQAALKVLSEIDRARDAEARSRDLAAVRELIEAGNWAEAEPAATTLGRRFPGDPEARDLLAEVRAGLEQARLNRERAAELYQLAAARDTGAFDQQALEWLREAAALDPDDANIAALLEKLASFTRTIRVPGDYDTPAEALAEARERDRIVLGENTWKGPLVINITLELEGAGADKTIIECPATEGSAITLGPGARDSRVSGIAFRHEDFDTDGADRFSAALVRGSGIVFSDCRFSEASGHGLAVIDGGEVLATRCRFTENGWNGAAAIGAGGSLEIRDSTANDNFGNGFEAWNNASLTLVNNRCQGNTRNGIHADSGSGQVVIEGNQLVANREFGLVLGSAAGGRATGNTIRGNLLGGIVVRLPAAAVTLGGNLVTGNLGPGLVLEKGLDGFEHSTNRFHGNKGRDLLPAAELD